MIDAFKYGKGLKPLKRKEFIDILRGLTNPHRNRLIQRYKTKRTELWENYNYTYITYFEAINEYKKFCNDQLL